MPISQPIFGVAVLAALQNGWVRDVVADEFTTGIVIDGGAKWITIQDSTVARTGPIDGSSGYPSDYSVDGTGVLVLRCTASGDNVFSFATQDRANGPNVVLDLTVTGTPVNVQPHQRWATGLLLDGIQTPTGGIGPRRSDDARQSRSSARSSRVSPPRAPSLPPSSACASSRFRACSRATLSSTVLRASRR